MPKLVTLRVFHSLGKEEARRRLQSGIARAQGAFVSTISTVEETWDGDHLDFRVRALGQVVTGNLEVEHDYIDAELALPTALAFFARKVKGVLARQGTLMLDHK